MRVNGSVNGGDKRLMLMDFVDDVKLCVSLFQPVGICLCTYLSPSV